MYPRYAYRESDILWRENPELPHADLLHHIFTWTRSSQAQVTTSSASARAPNRRHVIPTKVYCPSASLDALPRQRNRRSTHDDMSATTSSSFQTLMIGSMANRANANRCCFHTTKHSHDRLDGWCEPFQISRRMHMGFEHHRSGTHMLHGDGNCQQHKNLIGHPRQSHDDHMVNSVQLPPNFAGPVEFTNMRPKNIEISCPY